MNKQIECPYCDGVGIIIGNKGREVICQTCLGKGTIDDTEKSSIRPPNSEEQQETS